MRQQDFEQRHEDQWRALRSLLDALDRSRFWHRKQESESHQLPQLYREVCNHYALARSRHYSPALVAELHDLITRGHRRLYLPRGGWSWRFTQFLIAQFPRALRRNSRYFALATALFLVPALTVGTLCFHDPEMIFSVLDEGQVTSMVQMYDPDNRTIGRSPKRSSETNFMMFGFYIKNNIGIGFQTFSGGILLGLGTLFYLLFNGVVLGGVAGHLSQLGFHDTFWTFVSGHGAFELTAIVICGAAGLMLGHGVIAPGRLTRGEAIKRQAQGAITLVMGAAAMLVVAAFIEAFWSSLRLAPVIKYGVAGLLWSLVIAHLTLGGRER